MMMARLAALMIAVAMGLLLLVTFKMDGNSAIWFFFIGHPTLALGFLLSVIALARRLRAERAAARPARRARR